MQTENLIYGTLLALTLMAICNVPNAATTTYGLLDEDTSKALPTQLPLFTKYLFDS